jgi:hypothetical protein
VISGKWAVQITIEGPKSLAVPKVCDFISDTLIGARKIYTQLTGPAFSLHGEQTNTKD